jgi:hypothetical protein
MHDDIEFDFDTLDDLSDDELLGAFAALHEPIVRPHLNVPLHPTIPLHPVVVATHPGLKAPVALTPPKPSAVVTATKAAVSPSMLAKAQRQLDASKKALVLSSQLKGQILGPHGAALANRAKTAMTNAQRILAAAAHRAMGAAPGMTALNPLSGGDGGVVGPTDDSGVDLNVLNAVSRMITEANIVQAVLDSISSGGTIQQALAAETKAAHSAMGSLIGASYATFMGLAIEDIVSQGTDILNRMANVIDNYDPSNPDQSIPSTVATIDNDFHTWNTNINQLVAAGPAGATVAKVVVTPAQAAVQPGQPQQYTAQALDASGNPITPTPTVTWAVSPPTGASIDANGNLNVQATAGGGQWTVDAAIGGVHGFALAVWQTGRDGGLASGGGGGYGGDGGGGYGSDGGGGYGSDGGYGGDGGGADGGADGGGDGGGGDGGGGDGGGGDGGAADGGLTSPLQELALAYGGLDGGDGADGGDGGDGGGGDGADGGSDATSVMTDPYAAYGGSFDGADGGDGGGDGNSSAVGRLTLGPRGTHVGGGFDYFADIDYTPIDSSEIGSGLDLLGAYDIGQLQLQMNTLKQVTVGIARALVKGGQSVAKQTIDEATANDLPGITSLKNTQAHLQWHANKLSGLSDPTAMYDSSDDLKKWAMQAWIDANAVDEGAGYQQQAWDDMWTEIGTNLVSLPAKVANTVMAIPGQIVKGVTGIPLWAWILGGVGLVVLVGVGVFKLLKVATPVATHVAMARYLP